MRIDSTWIVNLVPSEKTSFSSLFRNAKQICAQLLIQWSLLSLLAFVSVCVEAVGEGKKRYTVAHFVPKWHNDTTAQTTTRRHPASVCKQTNKMQKPAGAAWLYIYFGSIWISNALKVYAAPLENRCGIFLRSSRWDDFLQICVCGDFCARGREILAEFREFYAAHTFLQEVLILMSF